MAVLLDPALGEEPGGGAAYFGAEGAGGQVGQPHGQAEYKP